eukprot:3308378-Pleurochrysis_carterae.AAC.1
MAMIAEIALISKEFDDHGYDSDCSDGGGDLSSLGEHPRLKLMMLRAAAGSSLTQLARERIVLIETGKSSVYTRALPCNPQPC